jgi:hypothetical protein
MKLAILLTRHKLQHELIDEGRRCVQVDISMLVVLSHFSINLATLTVLVDDYSKLKCRYQCGKRMEQSLRLNSLNGMVT